MGIAFDEIQIEIRTTDGGDENQNSNTFLKIWRFNKRQIVKEDSTLSTSITTTAECPSFDEKSAEVIRSGND